MMIIKYRKTSDTLTVCKSKQFEMYTGTVLKRNIKFRIENYRLEKNQTKIVLLYDDGAVETTNCTHGKNIRVMFKENNDDDDDDAEENNTIFCHSQ